MQQKIRTKFKELFNTEGSLYTSPGRINLIGEHTDYNGGFVFPGAVNKGMIAVGGLNGIDHHRQIPAHGILHTHRNIQSTGDQPVLLVLYAAGTDGHIAQQVA